MKKLITTIPGHPNVHRIEKENGEVRFLKTSPNGQIAREFSDYKLLSSFGISVPQVRVLPDGHKLFMEYAGVSVDDLLLIKPDFGLQVFSKALDDFFCMWEQTKLFFCEHSVERDYLQGSLKTLDILQKTQFYLLDKRLFINGKEFPSLFHTIQSCRAKLLNTKEEFMVLSHGDEYSLNIMAEQVRGVFTGGYKVIDPRDSGYYGLSAILNILIGQTLLHSFSRFVEVKTYEDGGAIFIQYSINEPLIFGEFLKIINLFLERVIKIGEYPLLSSYLFCNLARTLEPTTYLEKYRYKIHPARFFFYALAHQLFYK